MAEPKETKNSDASSDETTTPTTPTNPTTPTETPSNTNLIGCDFDVTTAQAVGGKNIVALVTDKTGENLLAIAGQQSLSFNMGAETTESAVKDESTRGWAIKFYGSKTWSASVEGLFSVDDEANRMVAKALANDEYLCLMIAERVVDGNTIKYKPIRKGIAIVTSDNFEAPNDDNATYSMDFEGSGKPWLCENATEKEIEDMTVTLSEN